MGYRPVFERLEPIALLTIIRVNCADPDPQLTSEETLGVALGQAQAGDTIEFAIAPGATFSGTTTFGQQYSYANPASGPFLLSDGGSTSVPVTIDGTTQQGYALGQPQVSIDGGYYIDLEGGRARSRGSGSSTSPMREGGWSSTVRAATR